MKTEINLNASVNTETLDGDIYRFDDPQAPLVSNSGIQAFGGITNLRRESDTIASAGDAVYITDEGGVLRYKNNDGQLVYTKDGETIFTGGVGAGGITTSAISGYYDDIVIRNGVPRGLIVDGFLVKFIDLDTGDVLETFTVTAIGSVGASIISKSGIRKCPADDKIWTVDSIAIYTVTGAIYIINFVTDTLVFNGATTWGLSDFNSYVEVYDYGNGTYLANKVGNTINRAYRIASGVSTPIKCTYLQTQAKNGYMRHLITAVPEIITGKIACVYGIGFLAFTSTFTSTPLQYNNTASTATSIDKYHIGIGAAEVIYAISSPTGTINNFIFPSDNPGDASPVKELTQNTKTYTLQCARLTNGWQDVTGASKEFRIQWSGGEAVSSQSYLSVSSGGNNILGVPICEVGAFDGTFSPIIYADKSSMIYRNTDGNYQIVTSSLFVSQIERINQTQYKINTVNPYNIFDTKLARLTLGANDYNGKANFSTSTVPGSTSNKLAITIKQDTAASIDFGTRFIQMPSVDHVTGITPFGADIKLGPTVALKDYAVNVYIDDVYKSSTNSFGTKFVDADPAEPLYLPITTVPVPLGSSYDNNVAVTPSSTLFLNDEFDGYEIGNDAQQRYTPFSLFGQPYLFDGKSIYLAVFDGSVLANIEFVCSALGLTYLDSSPTEAYFYSPFDISLYSFTGGRALQKIKKFTTQASIVDAKFSVHDNTLVIWLSDGSLLFVRDGIVTKLTAAQAGATYARWFSTVNGAVGIDSADTTASRFIFLGSTGTLLPITMQTAYMGQQLNDRSILTGIYIVLYSATREAVTLKTEVFSRDQDDLYTSDQIFNVKPQDYDTQGYARVRIIPKHQRALGTSVKLDISQNVVILDIIYDWQQEYNAVIAADKTR